MFYASQIAGIPNIRRTTEYDGVSGYPAAEKGVNMLSSTVCASCRSRKQKCDRRLPQCSRCERLWLKCHYSTPLSMSASIPIEITSPTTPPYSFSSQSQNKSQYNGNNEDEEQILINEFTHLQTTGIYSHLARLNQILISHKSQFDTMTNAFLTSGQEWLRIVLADDFRLGRVINPSKVTSSGQLLLDRGIVTLILAMCIITRPLHRTSKSGTGGCIEPDPLRHLMYVAAKQLFFCGDTFSAAAAPTTTKPTLALIQAGLLLSVYEYGQGFLDASHATISVCSSMVLVSDLPLPDARLVSPSQLEDEAVQTWWGIVIHERMISVKAGILVRPLSIINNIPATQTILNNDQLQAEIQSMLPRIVQNRHYAASYLRMRAAVWLDLVLEMVSHNGRNSTAGGMTFRDLDSGLISFLGILVQLGMGTCCEAIAIALNAFFYLHKWRLSSSSSSSSSKNTDSFSHESSLSTHAVQTILRILTDISTDHIPGVIHRDITPATKIFNHSNDDDDDKSTAKEGMFVELFPYAVHMIYLILLEVHFYRSSTQGPGQARDAFAVEVRVMRQILEKQTKRWGIACEYIAILDGLEV